MLQLGRGGATVEMYEGRSLTSYVKPTRFLSQRVPDFRPAIPRSREARSTPSRLTPHTIMLALLTAPSGRVLAPGAAAAIQEGSLHFEAGFMPQRLVADLRQDAEACAEAGLFERAGSGDRAGAADHMRSAQYCDPIARDRGIGCFDAFYALWERLDMARQELSEELGLELAAEMEIHYVRYPAGGFYHRHVDDETQLLETRPSRRAVSFICRLPCLIGPAMVRPGSRRAGFTSARGGPGRRLGAASLGQPASWAALAGTQGSPRAYRAWSFLVQAT